MEELALALKKKLHKYSNDQFYSASFCFTSFWFIIKMISNDRKLIRIYSVSLQKKIVLPHLLGHSTK